MRILKPIGFQWIAPLLVLISGILNLSIHSMPDTLRLSWKILVFISIILVIIGIINHYRFIIKKRYK
jgi:hypothetical protein